MHEEGYIGVESEIDLDAISRRGRIIQFVNVDGRMERNVKDIKNN